MSAGWRWTAGWRRVAAAVAGGAAGAGGAAAAATPATVAAGTTSPSRRRRLFFGRSTPAFCEGPPASAATALPDPTRCPFPPQLPPEAAARLAAREAVVHGTAFPKTLLLPTKAWGSLRSFTFCGGAMIYQHNYFGFSFTQDYVLGLYTLDDEFYDLVRAQTRLYYSQKDASKSVEAPVGRRASVTESSSDEDVDALTDAVLTLALTPEVSKGLVFRYVNNVPTNFVRRMERTMNIVVRGIKSFEFSYETFERMVTSFCTVLKKLPCHPGTTIVALLLSSPPPLTAFFVSSDPTQPLHFTGGVAGSMMASLLHCLFLEDPFTLDQQPLFSQAALHLRRELRARVEKAVRAELGALRDLQAKPERQKEG